MANMNIYEHRKEVLHKLIELSSDSINGATVLIPDLQRPFVWTPNQVTLLIDSLIRGWPFGTLLMWKIENETIQNKKIPHRSFWQTIDRTDEDESSRVGQKNPPASYHMVLDGQQRIQSLLIAVGGDDWGFKLYDRDWAKEISGQMIKGKKGKTLYWTKASLCFDLEVFIKEYNESGHVCAVDYSKVLKWMITDAQKGQSHDKKPKSYIESAKNNEGKVIRFSRLWKWAGDNPTFTEGSYEDLLKKCLKDELVSKDSIENLLRPMRELLVTIRNVKKSEVAYLELSTLADSYYSDEDKYNDAIVNIFTRLNTAGRTLTREEITFAWLKTGWDETATGNQTASKCFEELRKNFVEEKVTIEIDNLVGAVSTIWSILCKDGNLLEDKDLLKGDVVKPMAGEISKHWNNICEAASMVLDLLNKRDLEYKKQYYSMNALAIVWAWYSIAVIWGKENGRTMNVPERDDFQKKTRSILEKNIDRWLFGSQWAGRWRSDTRKPMGVYAKILHKSHGEIQATNDKDLALKILKQAMENLLDDIKDLAQQGVEDIKALEPDKVSIYKDILWIWHRLDVDRWEKSKITLRTGKNEASRDVDHCISHKLWERILKEAHIDNDPETYDEKNAVVNKLGNCSLLEKNFNISKSDKPMKSLLEQISEFKEGKVILNDWASALGLNDIMLNPQSNAVEGICNKINDRDKAIRDEVIEFIKGNKYRQDI